MINSVECLAKVDKSSQDSSWFLMTSVNVSVGKVKHENKVVFYRAARESTKLVKINMVFNVGPDPLNKKPFQAFADEGGEAKVSKVILRLGLRNLVYWKVKFLLIRLGPAVGCKCLTVNTP